MKDRHSHAFKNACKEGGREGRRGEEKRGGGGKGEGRGKGRDREKSEWEGDNAIITTIYCISSSLLADNNTAMASINYNPFEVWIAVATSSGCKDKPLR